VKAYKCSIKTHTVIKSESISDGPARVIIAVVASGVIALNIGDDQTVRVLLIGLTSTAVH